MNESTKINWLERVGQFGARSVLDLRHPANHYDLVTEQQKELLFPVLKSKLNGKEKSGLDFGCGPGRFTVSLAKLIDGPILGYDPIQPLIDLAPTYATVEYSSDAESYKNRKFDIVFICLVLGGLTEEALRMIAADLCKSLNDDGLLFLVEGTAEEQKGSHWLIRKEEYYLNLFSGIGMKKLGFYKDFDSTNTVFCGRKIN